MKTTVSTVQKMKDNGEKITMLTAYDYSTAKLFDEAGIDTMLVGDSLGMVMLGYDSTIPVTVDDMIHHGAAVAREPKILWLWLTCHLCHTRHRFTMRL